MDPFFFQTYGFNHICFFFSGGIWVIVTKRSHQQREGSTPSSASTLGRRTIMIKPLVSEKGKDLTQSLDKTNLSFTCLVSGILNFEHPSVLLFGLGEIGLNIRTHASPKVGQDYVSGGVTSFVGMSHPSQTFYRNLMQLGKQSSLVIR